MTHPQFKTSLALASLAVACLAAACAPPRPQAPQTLASPQGLAAARWCPEVDALGQTTHVTPSSEDCPLENEARLLVANLGVPQLHIIDFDLRDPAYLDQDRGLPGESGVLVPPATNRVAALAHPAFAVATSAEERALVVVNVPAGRRITIEGPDGRGDLAPLRDGPSLLMAFPEAPGAVSTVVVDEPGSGTLRWFDVSLPCLEGDRFAVDCDAPAGVREAGLLALGAPALDLALHADGRAYVALQGRSALLEVALRAPAVDELCGGAPCVVQELAIGPSCLDGVDDDGDGLIDFDDPQCFGPEGLEAGTPVDDGRLSACSNGLDDDGDGVVDADDPGCRDAADRDEGEAYAAPRCDDALDNDLDGLIDADDPDCETGEEGLPLAVGAPTGSAPASPTCSNGLDDDFDGLSDWPDDPDCYSAGGDGEGVHVRAVPRRLALTDAGDLLVVVDAARLELSVFSTETGERVDVNALDPLDEGPGEAIPTGVPNALVLDTLRFELTRDEDARRYEVEQRVAHITTTTGWAWTFVLDTAYRLYADEDDEGSPLAEESLATFRLFDQDPRTATASSVSCLIPSALGDTYEGVAGLTCSDLRFPRPVEVPDAEFVEGYVCPSADRPDLSYLDQPGDAYVRFPTEPAYRASAPASLPPGCGDVDESDPYGDNPLAAQLQPDGTLGDQIWVETAPVDAWIVGDDYEIVWEGELPTSRGEAGVFRDDWLVSVSGRPCESGVSLCESLVALDLEEECSEAASLCAAGVDVCAVNDPCTLCPAACSNASDFCSAGVIPGDTMVFSPFFSAASEEAQTECAAFARDVGGTVSDDALLEYRVLEVRPNAVRLTEIGSADDVWPAPRSIDEGRTFAPLPPTECQPEAIRFVARAGSSLVIRGNDNGALSPYRALDGACVPRARAPEFQGRVSFDVPYATFFGMQLEVSGGELQPFVVEATGESIDTLPRDTGLVYRVFDRYALREARDGQLLIGPSTSAGLVADTRRGRRIVFADEGQDYVWIYDAASFREIGAPLP